VINVMRRRIEATLARWLVIRCKRRAQLVGTRAAAVQLRKQGVPVSIARIVLAGEFEDQKR
jgi:hypothetical protein